MADKPDRKCGQYVVVRVCRDVVRDEWCNVGVIVFGPDGKQYSARMDTIDRAIRRGCVAGDVVWLSEWIADYPGGLPDLDAVARRLASDGHAMSRMQIRPPLATIVQSGVVDELYEQFVADEKRP